jgi:hypothetical protein
MNASARLMDCLVRLHVSGLAGGGLIDIHCDAVKCLADIIKGPHAQDSNVLRVDVMQSVHLTVSIGHDGRYGEHLAQHG